MVRRILGTGLGGLAGSAVWYLFVDSTGILSSNLWNSDRGARLLTKASLFSLAVCVFLGGALVQYLGESLRLFPSREQMEKQSRPISILPANDRDSKT
jgi:hypothetical protein